MFEIFFSVRADILPGQRVAVVGSLAELGLWNPHHACILMQKKEGTWEGARFHTEAQNKFEFKLIKVKENGQIQWESLPNNSNRKFKPRCPAKLHLQWSKPEGRISGITRSSFKLKGLPGVMLNQDKHHNVKSLKKEQEFDPYKNAQKDDSGQDQEQQFFLVKRKMSDQIAVDTVDIEEIYYNSSPLQIFCGLLKKLKLYVISRDLDSGTPFMTYIEQQLSQMPPSYLVKWITADCLLGKQKSNFHVKLRRRGSMFEVKDEQIHLQSLYSRTSYFMFLQIETVLKLQPHIGKIPSCLFLPSCKYQDVIDLLPNLSCIQLICFDDPNTNRIFYDYLKNHQQNQSSGGQNNEQTKFISITTPSISAITEELQQLRYKDTVVVNTLGSITEAEALKLVSMDNTVTIIDAFLADHYPSFVQKIVETLHHFSILIMMSPHPEVPGNALKFKDCKNIAIVYNQFQKVVLEGKEYHPLRNFREMLDLIRMKSKLYLQSYGGQFQQKQCSFIYFLPQGKEEWAIKVQCQCKSLSRNFGFVKVTRRGIKIKIVWNLALQARMIRTLCEIKYTNYGPLGNFHIISDSLSLRQLKDDLRLLVEHKTKLFMNRNDTKVRYFSYGGSKTATCHILPEQNNSETA